tara:strand:- start:126 stop:719 length:594 start_codon:yes stop_codon:yes gene_type:complete
MPRILWIVFRKNNLPIWKISTMNLEDAANVGEILGGVAILVTLIFGLRQIIELNKSKESEASRELANLLSSPIYQTGLSILINKLSDDFTLEDLDKLDRKEKDATNFLAINTNSIGLMTFERQLSFKSVTRFMQPINGMIGRRFRTLVEVLERNARNQGILTEKMEALDWAIWLLDRMDEQPPIEGPAHVLHRNWKP